MSFSTLPFLFYFLPAFLAVYYIVPARFRNAVLALGSLLFYWLGAGTGALLVLVALILVNFAAGRLIEDAHGDERRAWLILALACDVGSLFYFKYMGWFLENLGRLTNTDFSFFRVALPLGVSFYVFQSIAYVADVYRGDAEAERSLLDYAAFQAMFPQLVMGPILRLRDVSAELHTKRPFSRAAVESGFSLFVVGLGCKVVLADQLASLWTALERIGFAYLSAPLAWFGAVGYSLQLYYDFAGYSLMAMGLARMLGFVIPRNFDLPYCSRSISEFWRRWHITLGIWFRDYLYIPLGGSRNGGARLFWRFMKPADSAFPYQVDAHGPVARCSMEFCAVGLCVLRAHRLGKILHRRLLRASPLPLASLFSLSYSADVGGVPHLRPRRAGGLLLPSLSLPQQRRERVCRRSPAPAQKLLVALCSRHSPRHAVAAPLL